MVRAFLLVGCHVIGQCDCALSWLCLHWYKSVRRNCHWHVLMQTGSGYSKPMKDLMYSDVGIVLKSLSLALSVV